MRPSMFNWLLLSAPNLLFFVLGIGLGAPTVHAALHYQRLRSFGFPDQGDHPEAPVIQGSDGAFYGTTWAGGANSAGVVFKMNKDGSGYSVLHSFATNGVDGLNPGAGLLDGSDGVLYGTTSSGGTHTT